MPTRLRLPALPRAPLPAGARFCPQCGAALAAGAGAAPAGERRQVAILFADLAGYTALSNELDAEEMHRLLVALLRARRRR